MYHRLADFLGDWQYESEATLKLLRQLSDASLAQAVVPGGRTLGRLAWHVTGAPVEMLRHAGLPVEGATDDDPQPQRAADIAAAYAAAAAAVAELLPAHWPDARLAEEVPMYGERWTRGTVLAVLIAHQTHHRGQMTVLMRQAGLTVPGIYGPAREEWAAMGMPAPA